MFICAAALFFCFFYLWYVYICRYNMYLFQLVLINNSLNQLCKDTFLCFSQINSSFEMDREEKVPGASKYSEKQVRKNVYI